MATKWSAFSRKSPIFRSICSLTSQQATIDQDLQLLSELFEKAKHIQAKEVYNRGAFSRTFATLHFGAEGLPEEMRAQSPVTVASTDGETMLTGMLLDQGRLGAKSVRILYGSDNPLKCNVGGHPEPIVDGCTLECCHPGMPLCRIVPFTSVV